MAFPAVVLNVMIACPTDVDHEKGLARNVINVWNATHAGSNKIVLMPIAWDTDSVPILGQRTQSILNEQVCEMADLAIVIFHSRLGTKDESGVTGTMEEIQFLMEKDRRVMVYFSEKELPQAVDPEQLGDLREYIRTLEPKGILKRFKTDMEFTSALSMHLSKAVHDYQKFNLMPVAETDNEDKELQVKLLPVAAWIVKAASKTNNDTVTCRRYSNNGTVLQAGKYQVRTESPKIGARFWDAIQQLEDCDLIRPHSDNLWHATGKAFEFGETIPDSDFEGFDPTAESL